MFLVLFLFLGAYSGFRLLSWGIDNEKVNDVIKTINDKVIISEVKDNDDVKIVNPGAQKSKDNPYWDYIKMNLLDVDFSSLKSINSDVVGWIKVNGTNINYPFVQTTNNDYYLKRDFNKKYNSAGWVFLDYRNNINNLDKNTIIYAHGRIDGTMFGSLKNITKSNWYNDLNNHVVNISTMYSNSLWQVFSVYRIELTSDYLETNISNNEEYIKFLEMLKNRSEYKFDVDLDSNDKILTLSTCYKESDRVVLHAKLIKMEVKDGSN